MMGAIKHTLIVFFQYNPYGLLNFTPLSRLYAYIICCLEYVLNLESLNFS